MKTLKIIIYDSIQITDKFVDRIKKAFKEIKKFVFKLVYLVDNFIKQLLSVPNILSRPPTSINKLNYNKLPIVALIVMGSFFI